MKWLNIKWIDCICNNCNRPFKSRSGNDILCKKCKAKIEPDEYADKEEIEIIKYF
jgi:tRNA(Ile2) C34 agmatinyltransferase TiaS